MVNLNKAATSLRRGLPCTKYDDEQFGMQLRTAGSQASDLPLLRLTQGSCGPDLSAALTCS